MVTKLFLINLISVITASQIDRILLDDAIGNHKWLVYPFGAWAALSIISIPGWIIYIIYTW